MANKNSGKSKLELMMAWNKRPFIDKMLDDGESPNKVHKWMQENGLDVSVPTVYTYAKRRKEAIINGVKFEAVMDKRTNKSKKALGDNNDQPEDGKKQSKAKKKKRGRPAPQPPKETAADKEQKQKTVKRVKSELEILDAVIDKGFQTLQMMEVISPDMALKAIKLKHEITDGQHQGITMYGLEEIRMREVARENAITTVLLEYIPADKHDEVLDKMERITEEFYESVGLGDAYRMSQEEDEEEEDVQHG